MKRLVLGIAVMFLIINLASSVRIPVSFSLQTTITVPDDYATIQSALNASMTGDTIFVKAGTYYEHVVITKPVKFVGETPQSTIIDGSGGNGAVIRVNSDSVNITGFTIRSVKVGYEGVRLDNSSNCHIFNNTFFNNWYGIFLRNCSGNVISGNAMTNNVDGVHLEFHSNGNNVSLNTIQAESFFGIHLISSSNNRLVENSISSYLYGIYLRDSSSNNDIFQNSVTSNSYGIYVDASPKNNVTTNLLAKSDVAGMYFYSYSNNNTIYCNDFVDNVVQVNCSGGQKNLWDNSAKGNFWSDFALKYPNASELGNSGVWNLPYLIDANNTDNFPLTEQTVIPELPQATFVFSFLLACFLTIVAFRKKRHVSQKVRLRRAKSVRLFDTNRHA